MFNLDQSIDKIIRLANQITQIGIDGKTALKIASKTIYEMEVFARGLRNADWK